MNKNIQKHEVIVKIFTSVLFFSFLVYVFYMNELLKGRVIDANRLIICIILLYGSYRISQDFPLFLYNTFFPAKK